MTFRRFTALLILSACGEPASPAPPVAALPTEVSESLPTLVPMPLAIAAADEAETQYYALALADDGRILYNVSSNNPPLFRIVDSAGGRIAAFGRNGEGPGEFDEPTWAWSLGDSIFLPSRGDVMAAFDWRGKYLDEFHTGIVGAVTLGVRDSMVTFVDLKPGYTGKPLALMQISLRGGAARHVHAPSDSLVQGKGLVKPYGASVNRTAVGNGMTYRIDVYDVRDSLLYQVYHQLPPRYRDSLQFAKARQGVLMQRNFRGPNGERIAAGEIQKRLDALKDEPIAHFMKNALFFDGKGRLWVFGRNSDSTFADVFADTRFLGRLTLACAASLELRTLRNHWLALDCEEDGSTHQLRLYRIEG